MNLLKYLYIYIYIYIYILVNRIQNKHFCLHNMCACIMYIYYVYINTHTAYILKIFTCIYLYSYHLYHVNIFHT